MFACSLVSTFLLMPVSFVDAYFVKLFFDTNLIILFTMVLVADAITAMLAYKFSGWLAPKVIKKEKTQKKFEKISNAMSKWGWGVVFLAAATPFPYTLTIYAAGLVQWQNEYVLATGIVAGKFVRYIVIGIGLHYGIEFITKWL